MNFPSSNTLECYQWFIGSRLLEVIEVSGSRRFFFDNGYALCVVVGGGHSVMTKAEVRQFLQQQRSQLEPYERTLIAIRRLEALANTKQEEDAVVRAMDIA